VKIHVCVTTASIRLGEADLARQPWAGGLLAVEAGVRGLPDRRFGG